METPVLAGLRVIVVEDELLVSMLIEDILVEQNCVIVGPFHRVDLALETARGGEVDLAVLDVNVAGVKVWPVAEILESRRIPFLLLSGYGPDAVPADHPEWPVCAKPFRPEMLIAMLMKQVQAE
jgi:two-component SAPR family response regulator